MSLRLAQIVDVHPERRTVDICFLDNGFRLAEVRVMSEAAASDGGSWRVPSAPPPPSDMLAGGLVPSGRRLLAVVGSVAGKAIVLGFLPPSGGAVTFNQQDRDIHVHSSGAYWTIAPDGSVELWHPGGGYFRIGTGAHEDLTPIAVNGWSFPEAEAPTVTVITQGNTIVATPGGPMTFTSAQFVFNGPSQFNGNIDCSGSITADGDVTAAGKSLDHHTHTAPSGGGITTPPN